MFVGVLLERLNWCGKTKSECGQHHPVDLSSRLDKKDKASWAPAFFSLCCDCGCNVPAALCSCGHAFPLMTDHSFSLAAYILFSLKPAQWFRDRLWGKSALLQCPPVTPCTEYQLITIQLRLLLGFKHNPDAGVSGSEAWFSVVYLYS